MKKLLIFLLVFNVVGVCLSDIRVTSLKCEYQAAPVGIDTANPRLSWVLQSGEYDQCQTAYQILVADKSGLLTETGANYWNSGKVKADTSINVKYDGIPLESLKQYYWKVRTWDRNGDVSQWSTSGSWTTGLMDSNEFQGQWITYSKPLEHEVYNASMPIDLDHAEWLWGQSELLKDGSDKGVLVFSRMVQIDDTADIKSAGILLTADDSFKLYVNGVSVGSSDSWQVAVSFDLADYLKTGPNLIEVEAVNSDGPGGMVCKIVLQDGTQQKKIVSDSDWKVRRVGDPMSQSEKVRIMGSYGTAPWSKVGIPGQDTFWTQKSPSPLLRKEFRLKKEIDSSYAVISGLGFYELRINGRKVGDKVLDPVLTNYSKTVLYSTYDVSGYLKKGDNAVGIMLANGWYNSHTKAAWNYDSAPWRDKPKALLNIIVNYADGTSERICTDASWTGSNGPLVADAIRSGEVYDARREQPGWDRPRFASSSWEPVQIATAPKGKLHSEIMPATKIHETIKPVAITEPQDGVYIVDMGVNIAGWAKIRVKGQAGQKITLRYGEKLKKGLLDTDNIRGLTFSGPFQTDTYYLKGQGTEEWHPRFVYHGFRYVEVTGLDQKPSVETIQAQMVYTDFETIGTFKCSNELLNTIQELTDRSYKSNFVGIPTDCPQREKNGWTADAHLAAEQAMLNYDNLLSYEKWLGDFRDDQDANGRYSCIIPSPNWGARDLTEWDSAYMIVAWYLYLYRHDIKVIENNYENMKRYIANVKQRIQSNEYIVEFGLGDWANDGGSVTPVPLTATAYFYYDLVLMERFADILQKQEDLKYFSDLSVKVKAAYNQKFYKGKGLYADGQQTALSMSLFYDLVPPSERKAVEMKLIEAILKKGHHHDTGILGAKCIFRVLSEMGQSDLAMKMLNQKTMPSYGYWIENGATSLYENWTNNPGSMNHIMFGDISGWFYNYLGGIQADPDNPGFKHVIIKPEFAESIDWVQTTYQSPYGPIQVNWKISVDTFTCQVQVPVNTKASVVLHSSDSGTVKLDGKRQVIPEYQNDSVIYTIGSGLYTFTGKR